MAGPQNAEGEKNMKRQNKNGKCAVCGGRLLSKLVKHDQHWGEQLVVFEDVPANVCLSCGEVWLDAKIVRAMNNLLVIHAKPTRTIDVPVWNLAKAKAA